MAVMLRGQVRFYHSVFLGKHWRETGSFRSEFILVAMKINGLVPCIDLSALIWEGFDDVPLHDGACSIARTFD